MNLAIGDGGTLYAAQRLSTLVLPFILCLAATPIASSAEAPPNVVVIFADDLGYGDLSCYGATKVRTPNIDRLVAEGRRFTDAHSASAVCTPSRYALLTGEYPHRKNLSKPVFLRTGLVIDTEQQTAASVMKDAGYATACIGKWHLGFGERAPDWNGELKPGPLEVGFDYYYGVPVVNSHPPFVYVENHKVVGLVPDDPFVFGKQAKTRPFFEKMGLNQIGGADAAHALYDDEAVGTTLAGKAVDWIKDRGKHPFFLYLATTNIHHPFTPAARFQGTSECGPYGDFIHELDWIVGEVMNTLEDQGVAENTLVIFTSDNGGMFNVGGQNAWDAGHRLNGQLLGFKFGAWEGGHRVPFIARWPGRIRAGSVSDQLISNIDLIATLSALTGRKLKTGQAQDSVNVLPALIDDPAEPIRDHIVLAPSKRTHLAVRKGKWMYIGAQGSGGFTAAKRGAHAFGGPAAITYAGYKNSDIENGRIKEGAPPAQLYDLEQDLAQTTNLYAENPEVVKELAELLSSYLPQKSEPPGDGNRGRQSSRRQAVRSRSVLAADSVTPNTNAKKPNFVVIFADDLGYGDISCYGPTGVETPNIDALAAEGFRSTDFFVPANVCSPSRAALLTGRYPMRCGMPVARIETPGSKYKDYGFAPEEVTIPELLKPAGYRSLMVGKWHLGMEVQGSHPIDAGFDEHLGIPSNYGKNRGPNFDTLYRGKQIEQKKVPCEELTRRYTDEVVEFIGRQADRPFFIYVSHHIVHTPLLPRRDFVGSSKKGRYGDFIKELDHSTGRIMKAIRDAGLDDHTLVVFTSDYGPTQAGSTGGLNGGKYCTMEGGHRVPGVFRWPGSIPSGQVSSTTISSMDLLPLFAGLAGVKLPANRTIDGKDILPILLGQATKSPHEFFYYYNGTNLQAVREGNWKLHLPRSVKDQPFWSKNPRQKWKGYVTLDEAKLFDLKQDLGESQDLADRYPQVVARLKRQAELIRAELGDVHQFGRDQRNIHLVDPQER